VIASGHLASFDRRKCKGPLNGPTATGQHCPEGWTLYQLPGPQLKGVTDPGSAEASYYDWVDQFDTLGLGANMRLPPATEMTRYSRCLPDTGKFVCASCPVSHGILRERDGWPDRPIQTLAGREKDCGQPTALALLFTRKVVKERRARSWHFQLRPDHSRTRRLTRAYERISDNWENAR